MGGLEVLHATIARPRVGAWVADLEVDGDPVSSGAVTISGGGSDLVGSVVRGGAPSSRGAVRIVGGGGGLGVALSPRFYRGVPARVVLADLCRDAGEELASTSDPGVLSTVFPRWVRVRGSAGALLGALLRSLPAGTVWRVQADGKIWVGLEAWAAAPADEDRILVGEDAADGRLTWAVADLSLRGGLSIDGRRVGHVVHRYGASESRVEGWIEASEG